MKKLITIFILVLLLSKSALSQSNVVQENLRLKTKAVTEKIFTDSPLLSNPVMINAKLVWSDDKKQAAVILKVNIHFDWHIYAIVPPTQPYISSQLILDLPEEISAIGDWIKPSPYPSDNGVFVYKGELVFTQYLNIDKTSVNGMIKCGLYYQTCDLRQCLPPQSKIIKLNI